ncbi:hypothetical protein [Burkholderia cepacia]|uniref:hypothetical protein n=1 Tax=Burkholderia cepacia TaxID=292 RepID=UPI00157738E9|nr:hypothetical protein [Burkholderia cepacia]NTX19661.1 hypothetical protein [Burkholderia cepacia]
MDVRNAVRTGAVDAPVRGNMARQQVRVQAHPDDEALILAYVEASSTRNSTASTHASWLRQLAGWLRAPGDHSDPRPTLGVLREELFASGTAACEHPDVRAFRQAVGETSSVGKNVASALNALVRGNTAWQQVRVQAHPDDEALILAYVEASSTRNSTASAHASWLRRLAGWLRARGDHSDPRPTLGALRKELSASDTAAREHPHVRAFRQAVGEASSVGRNVASALDALVRGNTVRKQVWGQDHPAVEALIRAYVQDFQRASGQPRPTIPTDTRTPEEGARTARLHRPEEQ